MNDEKQTSKSEEFDFEDESFRKEEKVIDSNMIVSGPQEKKSLGIVIIAILIGVATWKFLPKSSKHVQESQVQDVEKQDALIKSQSEAQAHEHEVSGNADVPVTDQGPRPTQEAQKPNASIRPEPPVAQSAIVMPVNKDQHTQEVKKALDERVLSGFDDKLTQQSEIQNNLLEQISELTQRLKSLDQEMKNIVSQNEMMSNKLDDMNKFDKSVSLAIDSMKVNINSLKEQIKGVDGKLAKQGAELFSQDDLKNIKKQAITPGAELAVHAAIPGRVWLRDQNNRIFSVVEGEELPGYGKILSIDPRLATVMTASGMIIRQ